MDATAILEKLQADLRKLARSMYRAHKAEAARIDYSPRALDAIEAAQRHLTETIAATSKAYDEIRQQR